MMGGPLRTNVIAIKGYQCVIENSRGIARIIKQVKRPPVGRGSNQIRFSCLGVPHLIGVPWPFVSLPSWGALQQKVHAH